MLCFWKLALLLVWLVSHKVQQQFLAVNNSTQQWGTRQFFYRIFCEMMFVWIARRFDLTMLWPFSIVSIEPLQIVHRAFSTRMRGHLQISLELVGRRRLDFNSYLIPETLSGWNCKRAPLYRTVEKIWVFNRFSNFLEYFNPGGLL